MIAKKHLLAGMLAVGLALIPAACSKSETETAADAQEVSEGSENGEGAEAAEQAGNALAPSASGAGSARPSSGVSSSRPASGSTGGSAPVRGASQVAGGSSTAGWGDQPSGSVSTAAATPTTKTYTLAAGSPVRIRTTSTMSSKDLSAGDTFYASLAEPLQVNGRVIAERGARVTGRVVESDAGGRVKGKAILQVAITNVELVNGESANVSVGAFEQQAEAGTKRDAAKVAIGSGIGAAIGAIAGGGKGAAIGAGVGAGAGTGAVLATRGEAAVIPAESMLTFTTNGPVSVELPQ
jgi:hypothetical protein